MGGGSYIPENGILGKFATPTVRPDGKLMEWSAAFNRR